MEARNDSSMWTLTIETWIPIKMHECKPCENLKSQNQCDVSFKGFFSQYFFFYFLESWSKRLKPLIKLFVCNGLTKCDAAQDEPMASAKGHLGESFDEHIILHSFISQHGAKTLDRFALIFFTKKGTAETLVSYKFPNTWRSDWSPKISKAW